MPRQAPPPGPGTPIGRRQASSCKAGSRAGAASPDPNFCASLTPALTATSRRWPRRALAYPAGRPSENPARPCFQWRSRGGPGRSAGEPDAHRAGRAQWRQSEQSHVAAAYWDWAVLSEADVWGEVTAAWLITIVCLVCLWLT